MLAIPNETEELARRLARRIGKTPEDVIRDALVASVCVYGVTDDETIAAANEHDLVMIFTGTRHFRH